MSDRIVFKCPECRKPLTVTAGSAGKKARCPGCRNIVAVPLGEPQKVKPPARLRRGRQVLSALVWVIFCLCLGVELLAIKARVHDVGKPRFDVVETCWVRAPDGGYVFLAKDLDRFGEINAMQRAGDYDGLLFEVQMGRAWAVKSGSKVMVNGNESPKYCRVHILDFDSKGFGQDAYISVEYLISAKDK